MFNYQNSDAGASPSNFFIPGMIIDWGGPTAPIGWLLCDNAEYDPVLYPALFAAIGFTYNTGGETPGWFRVPQCLDRVRVGAGLGFPLGNLAGAYTQALVAANNGPHTHGVTDPGHNHTQNAHTHTQDSHNHTQNAHTHTQDSHNHTQNAHTHTQNAHDHATTQGPLSGGAAGPVAGGNLTVAGVGNVTVTGAGSTGLYAAPTTATNQNTTATNQATTATNQNTTATNQATTATNQNTTATNQASSTGVTVNSQGAGDPFSIIQPVIAVTAIIKY